jgi:hypothetical protein
MARIKMKRKARDAEGIQYTGVHDPELDAMLTSVGYTNINILSGCLMARGGSNNKELLCLYIGDWMIQGQNGTIWRETKKAIDSKYDITEDEEEVVNTTFDGVLNSDWSEHLLKVERGLANVKWELAERKFKQALYILSRTSAELKRMRSAIIRLGNEENK